MNYDGEQFMFYEPRTGTMMAIGSKKHIEAVADNYMKQMAELIRMMKREKQNAYTSM